MFVVMLVTGVHPVGRGPNAWCFYGVVMAAAGVLLVDFFVGF